MLPHPHLWPAIIGASLGLAAVVYACLWYAKRWGAFTVRQRWMYGLAIALFEAIYWLNVYAWLIEPRMLVVRRVEIASEDWHGPPLTIAAVGDTHVGSPHVSAGRVERLVERINDLEPDIVVLLGDYVGGHAPEAERSARANEDIARGLAAFVAIDAPLGVVAVIGNHDVWYDRQTVTRLLDEAGVATLWNRNVVVSRPGAPFVIAGLEDDTEGRPDLAAARDGAPPLDTIVLSHSPDPFAQAPDDIALMLAGHGHCGQVTIPLIGRPITPLRNPRYSCHLIEENGRVMYVTAGVGTSIVPVRFLNPPEIVLITLRSVQTPASPG